MISTAAAITKTAIAALAAVICFGAATSAAVASTAGSAAGTAATSQSAGPDNTPWG